MLIMAPHAVCAPALHISTKSQGVSGIAPPPSDYTCVFGTYNICLLDAFQTTEQSVTDAVARWCRVRRCYHKRSWAVV